MGSHVVPAFTEEEAVRAHRLLATRVAYMMGRKLEEGDWEAVYCGAKDIEVTGWSNLNVDVIHDGMGVEQKMLRVRSDKPIASYCGTSLMHPSATRSLRIDSTDADPNEVMRDILAQYSRLIDERAEKVREQFPDRDPEMRLGWLLWQESLREFLYFEELWRAPDPNSLVAFWNDRDSRGSRKSSKSLWVYRRDTDHKVMSVTTAAGIKLQPYFDVPAPGTEGLYIFTVQGDFLHGGLVRVWVTSATAAELRRVVGGLQPDQLNEVILSVEPEGDSPIRVEEAVRSVEEVVISGEAYARLGDVFAGVSDEHNFQLLLQKLKA